jgi:signal transduction histidine kinase
MDQFLGMASHEMKSPLTALSANLQLTARRVRRLARLGERETAGETVAMDVALWGREVSTLVVLLDRAQGAARRMTRLVNELLDVSRIQTGRMEIHPEPSDLIALTRAVIAEVRVSHPGRVFQLEEHSALPLALADPDRVSEAIENYLSNAAKYSPAETAVYVTLAATDDGMARLAVRDEGNGVPPATQARIWNVFERLETGVSHRTSGVNLGLGLHICKTIIELHGGQVGVESAVGAGSTFWFTLPLAAPPEA